jgi:hypothetical protein
MRRLHFAKLLGAAALATALMSVTVPARASLVVALDLAGLTARAERVVVGEVLSVQASWDASHKKIYSTVVVQVAETWKGEAPGDGRVVIVQPGGVVGDIEMHVHGMPHFAVGDRGVLFLTGALTQATVVGLGQGMRPLHFNAQTARWIVEAGDRSAAVLLDGHGGTRPAPPEPALPLQDMRSKVRELLRARP